MRLKQLAVAAGVVLVAAFAALAIAVHYLDPRSLTVSLAAAVKADTGRELSFGEVAVKLLPRPAVVWSELRFGNAAWGSQPWLAQANRVSADIDLLALLSGRLRIANIAVAGASLLLETDRDGKGNWVLGSADAPSWLRTPELDELALQELAFTYRDGATGKATSVQLDSARIVAGAAARPIQLSARGSFAGKSLEATGTIGALAALIANAPAYPIDIDGKFGAASLSVHGTIDQPRQPSAFKLALTAQMPEFAEYAALFGAAMPPLGPFRGATRLTGTAAAPVFSAIDVELGTPQRMSLTARGELTGSIAAGGGYAWQSSGVDLLLQGAQFGDLAQWSGKSLPALGPYRIAARLAGAAAAPALSAIDMTIGGGGRPEIRLSGAVASLRPARGIDLKLAAAATDWWHITTAGDGPRLPPFRLSARLRDARQGYRVDELDLKIAGSTVSAALTVVQGGPRLRITGTAASPLIDLARLAPGKGAATAAAAAESPRAADHWKFADVDLDLKIGRLVFPDGRQLRSGSGRLALDDGRLQARALQATLGGASVKLDGSVADPQKLAGLDLNVALQGGELAELFKFFGKSIPPAGPYQGRARLHGSLDALRVTAIDAGAGRPGQKLHASGQIDDVRNWRGLQLAITAKVGDSTAAGRLFGADLPHLPALRATARLTGPQGGYVFDDLKLTLGHTSVQGRVAYAPGAPRPHVTANLTGPLVDLAELPLARTRPGDKSPLLAADVEADIRFDRVVLPGRQTLGQVSGGVRLAAGAVALKQLSVAVDGASATLDGRINDPLTPAGLELMVNAKLTRGTGLAAFTGLRLQSLPAFTASGTLTDAPDGYALTGLKLAHAATTVTGDLTLTRGAKRYKLSARASSPLLDLSASMPPAAAGSAAKPVVAGTRAIPDLPLPLDVLRVVDADLDLRVDAVKINATAPLGPLLVRAVIADGRLKAEPVQLAVHAGQTLNLSATADAAQTAWALRIDGKGIDFGELLDRFGHPGLVTGGSTDLALQVGGRGKSLAAVLGSLNGDARVKIGPHRVHNFAVNLEGGILMRMFGLANSAQKTDPDTEVQCFAAHLPVRNGVLTSERNVAAETARYNAVMSGTVDLRTELLHLALAPIVTGGSGIGNVNVIVRVRGTLVAPTIGVDTVDVAMKSAASVGATVMTLGAWWMADTVLKQAIADPHPCVTALGAD